MWDVAAGFVVPAAAKFDAAGLLYIVDQAAGNVTRLNLANGQREVFATLTPGLDNLAFDAKGRLFVSSAEDGFIVEVLPNGKGRPVSPGGMIAPGGVAVLPGNGFEQVYVGDLWTLRRFDGQTGKELSVEREEMWGVHTVAPDGANLLVSSFMDNAVFVYDPLAGSLLETRFDFFGPMNAIRFQGDLIVSELGTGSVLRSAGPGDRQVLATLGLPIGLAATDDDLFVADWAIGAVFQLVQDGAPVMIPLAFGLSTPEGLAVLPDGSLLVVESGAGRVSRIDPATGTVTPYVENLELGGMHLTGIPPFWIFNGIAVGASGAVYVTGDSANVLYRIEQRP
jgi:DNA-binding beta-propeller fold protein YncE